MSCVIQRFGFKVGDWVRISNPQKPGKVKIFKVMKENWFHQPDQPSSFQCGCNYKLASKGSLTAGKEKTFTLSSQPTRQIAWNIHLDSKSSHLKLDPGKVRVIKQENAKKIV